MQMEDLMDKVYISNLLYKCKYTEVLTLHNKFFLITQKGQQKTIINTQGQMDSLRK